MIRTAWRSVVGMWAHFAQTNLTIAPLPSSSDGSSEKKRAVAKKRVPACHHTSETASQNDGKPEWDGC